MYGKRCNTTPCCDFFNSTVLLMRLLIVFVVRPRLKSQQQFLSLIAAWEVKGMSFQHDGCGVAACFEHEELTFQGSHFRV